MSSIDDIMLKDKALWEEIAFYPPKKNQLFGINYWIQPAKVVDPKETESDAVGEDGPRSGP
jgi:hypothetical protein